MRHGMMMAMAAIGLLSVPMLASSAWAVSLSYVADERRVTAGAGMQYNTSWGSDSYWSEESKQPTSAYADFDTEVTWREIFGGNSGDYEGGGWASQQSTLEPSRIRATGHAETDGDLGYGSGGDPEDEASYWYEEVWVAGYALSTFSITFMTDEPIAIDLLVTIPASSDDSRATLRGASGNTTTYFDSAGLAGDEWLVSLVLPAGTYRLFGSAEAADLFAVSDFSIDMIATSVPEPGTAMLVATGLLATSLGRKRWTSSRE